MTEAYKEYLKGNITTAEYIRIKHEEDRNKIEGEQLKMGV